ncbi:MAG: hypothetical protein A2Y97_14380 [Nitrospirae bacterium RBG_13_39_12]|nr:MAG: hypothetical protein A2Y97_14380 [Nitrospirae bacterium RBG_13_39_12]
MNICEYPIIIGGFYRSGTSLLRRLLDAHSNIHCNPEIKFFKDFYGDYLHDDLSHVRFFSTLKSLGLNQTDVLNIFGKAFIACHQMAAKHSGKKRWADKNPENVLYMQQWHSLLEGKLFFIHMVRHPLDALASLIEIGFKRAVPSDFKEKVKMYRTFLHHGLDYTEKNPHITILIRYEDLVSNPQEVLTALLKMLGETYEPSMLLDFNSPQRQRGIEDPKIIHTSGIHLQSINRWQKELSPEQIHYALTELEQYIVKFHYFLS